MTYVRAIPWAMLGLLGLLVAFGLGVVACLRTPLETVLWLAYVGRDVRAYMLRQ